MKKYQLGRKTLLAFLVLSVTLILCICASFSVQYWKGKMDEYSRLAFSYARTAVEYIDGDRVLGYVETGVKDDYYRQVQNFLNITQEQTDVKYYYVFVPYEDDLVYVWDADKHAGAQDLGYHEPYLTGGKEAVEKIYRQNPPEEISLAKDDEYGYIASAYSPIFNSDGEPIAVVGVDLSMRGIEQELFEFIVAITLSVIAVIVISVAVFYTFIKKRVIQPINQLNAAASGMAEHLEHDKLLELDIHTGDEIEELAEAFKRMDGEVRDYIDKLSAATAEKERIGAELNVARQIQSSMLPCIFPPFPERGEFDIYAMMNPAKEVGGDFYDLFMVDEKHLAVVVADVSGKGVPAALFMVIGKTLMKDHTRPDRDLGEIFTEVNEILCESNSEGLFITAFEGVLNLETGEFRFVNAGHEPPLLCKKGGAFEPCVIPSGFVLAGLEGMKYQAGRMQLEPGDKIFQYTDGVTEAMNAQEELYGLHRLMDVLNEHTQCSPKEILPLIKADIDRFVCGAPQYDDITMLCLEYRERMTVSDVN